MELLHAFQKGKKHVVGNRLLESLLARKRISNAQFTASRSRSKFSTPLERQVSEHDPSFFYSSALELRVGLAARDKTAASARPSRLRRAHRAPPRTRLDGVARRTHLPVISRLRRGWARRPRNGRLEVSGARGPPGEPVRAGRQRC